MSNTQRLLRLILSLALATVAGQAFAAQQVIYLAPSGLDRRDGTSPANAVHSLQRAVALAESVRDAKVDSVRISVAPGVYRAQTVTTKGLAGGRELVLTPLDPRAERPRFDGDGKGGTWFTLRNASGQPSRIRIVGLEISNYLTAISLNGNRDRNNASNGGNEIRDNVFSNIGQIADPAGEPSTAALRLVNSDGNLITRNRFVGIRNVEMCGRLHAIYVAHRSTGNIISENSFEDSCGDALRFRDASNDNTVSGNTFTDAWDKTPVSDWYCDHSLRTDCTKASDECPSMNNLLTGNRVVSKKLKPTQIFFPYGADSNESCPAGSHERRAFIR